MQTDTKTETKDWSPPKSSGMQKRIENRKKQREIERQVWSIYRDSLDLCRLANSDSKKTREDYLREACAARGVNFDSFHAAYIRMKAEGAAQALADYCITWPPPDDLTL